MDGRENPTLDWRETEGREVEGRAIDWRDVEGRAMDCLLLGRTDFLETLGLGNLLILKRSWNYVSGYLVLRFELLKIKANDD